MYEKLLIARLINTSNSKLVSSPIMDLIIPIIYRIRISENVYS